MPYRNPTSYHHIDYLLFGAAFTLQQARGLLHGFGTIASGILAVAAVVRAATELIRLCRAARMALPEDAPPFRSFCPFAAICRGGPVAPRGPTSATSTPKDQPDTP